MQSLVLCDITSGSVVGGEVMLPGVKVGVV